MASEERKAADAKIAQENLFKTLGAEEVQAETDAFQCGRCKQVGIQCMSPGTAMLISLQRKCRYRQAQTRSADEPMTVCASSRRSTYFTDDTLADVCNVRIQRVGRLPSPITNTFLLILRSCTVCNNRFVTSRLSDYIHRTH